MDVNAGHAIQAPQTAQGQINNWHGAMRISHPEWPWLMGKLPSVICLVCRPSIAAAPVGAHGLNNSMDFFNTVWTDVTQLHHGSQDGHPNTVIRTHHSLCFAVLIAVAMKLGCDGRKHLGFALSLSATRLFDVIRTYRLGDPHEEFCKFFPRSNRQEISNIHKLPFEQFRRPHSPILRQIILRYDSRSGSLLLDNLQRILIFIRLVFNR